MKKRKPRRAPKIRARPVPALVAEWPLPTSAALGSSVRLMGIEREVRARLPWLMRTCLSVENGRVLLGMAAGEETEFEDASRIVAGVVNGIETLPVLPGEVEDILTITAHERQRWLKDGRLKSAGTRTVKLRGRAKAVTFHVFDPREIEDVLNRDLPTIWREEDRQATAENRRRAAAKAALKRADKVSVVKENRIPPGDKERLQPALRGWSVFAEEGLLR